jgi:hypothetical protein
VVHAIDNSEVNRQSADLGVQVAAGEEGVSGLGEYFEIPDQGTSQLGIGVDTDYESRWLDESQRVPLGNADLDASARLHEVENAREDLKVVFTSQLNLSLPHAGCIHLGRNPPQAFAVLKRKPGVT